MNSRFLTLMLCGITTMSLSVPANAQSTSDHVPTGLSEVQKRAEAREVREDAIKAQRQAIDAQRNAEINAQQRAIDNNNAPKSDKQKDQEYQAEQRAKQEKYDADQVAKEKEYEAKQPTVYEKFQADKSPIVEERQNNGTMPDTEPSNASNSDAPANPSGTNTSQ